MEIFVTIGVKLVISFFGLWIITFITGRKTLSQLTPLDFLSSLILSEIVGNTIYDDEVKIWHLLFALFVWTALSYLFEKVTTHFVKFGNMAEGRTVLLIDDGKVNQDLLEKYDIEYTQLLFMLRQQNIFSLSEVRYALLETNGSLSVMRKSEDEQSSAFSVTVIDKGRVLEESMRGRSMNKEQIKERVREQGYNCIEDIAYAEYKEDGTLYILPKNKP
ncbi:DUF421 domain-containing protein [Paenibacillus sp. FSL R7-0189]|uniref:DUF421 domain-containing protein n=1 Tax=Paenibacillus sp. FSL R7-0189 TaxID=2921673 RepID=UPI0030D733A2